MDWKQLTPLSDRILVERFPEETERGGIIIPDIAQEKNYKGVVLATGPGRLNERGQRIPVDVKPGDIVVFGQYVDLENGKYVMMMEGDIRGILPTQPA